MQKAERKSTKIHRKQGHTRAGAQQSATICVYIKRRLRSVCASDQSSLRTRRYVSLAFSHVHSEDLWDCIDVHAGLSL